MTAETLELFNQILEEQAVWSQETFGADGAAGRGPVGPLKHLAKEAKEAADAPDDIVEYADCFLLLADAMRRGKFTWPEMLRAAYAKLQVCKYRDWPEPVDDEPTEHVRTNYEELINSIEQAAATQAPAILVNAAKQAKMKGCFVDDDGLVEMVKTAIALV